MSPYYKRMRRGPVAFDLRAVHALIVARFNLNYRVGHCKACGLGASCRSPSPPTEIHVPLIMAAVHGATGSSSWAKPNLLAFNHIGLPTYPLRTLKASIRCGYKGDRHIPKVATEG